MGNTTLSTELDVVGIGNAIVDVLANTTEELLPHHGVAKGAMTLIDAPAAERLYGTMSPAIECSGGSAANTMVGLASLGGRSGYIGKVAADQLGAIFRHDIHSAGVRFDTLPTSVGSPTARCLILVTPDAQRTMQTYLGACVELTEHDIDEALISAAQITYLEGYLWDKPSAKAAFQKAIKVAHAHGRRVAVTLSDRFCVERHRQEFQRLARIVDILFANEVEMLSLYEADNLDAAVAAARHDIGNKILAVTRGENGSIAIRDDEVVAVSAEPVPAVVDTTGAGDLYAAGFLFGLTRGWNLRRCAWAGSIAAAEIISHFGARPATSLQELIGTHLGAVHRMPNISARRK